MNDAEFTRWHTLIDERLVFWIPRMGLHHWQRHITYRRDQGEDHGFVHPKGYGTPFCITCDWRYMQFHLEAFIGFIHDVDPSPSALDRMIVHELGHCILAELRQFVPDEDEANHINHEERVNSWYTLAICGLYEDLEKWDRKQQRKIKRLEQEVQRLKAMAA